MGRMLAVDVGAGTMDLLWYDTESGHHYKAVVKSPIRWAAEVAAAAPGNLLVTGCEMGGGQLARVLRERAASHEVVVTTGAAATLHHDPGKLRSWNIRVISEEEAAAVRRRGTHVELKLADLDPDRLERIVVGLGVPFEFDVVAACAQDHGVAPQGVSHLDFRHSLFEARLREVPLPHTLLYRDDEVPPVLSRLLAMVRCARGLPTREVYVMDSGMAAILGASVDERVRDRSRKFLLDVATSHTVGATMVGEELAGFFEYHTADVTTERLDSLFRGLSEGTIDHERVLAEGGHGAFLRAPVPFADGDFVVATGPRRRLVEGSRLPIVPGAPLGDNMMTGTLGLLEAIRRRKGLGPIPGA